MLNKKIARLVIYLIGALILSSVSFGQIILDQKASASIRYYYNSWSFKDSLANKDNISQLAIPITGFVPLRENLEARFFAVNASNNLDYRETTSKLSGQGDLRFQLSHSLWEDRFLLSVGANLPTGKKQLDTLEEKEVLEFLSRDYLMFPVRRYSEGFGLNMLLGTAMKIGKLDWGMTTTYQLNGEYEPYDTGEKYKPGNMLSIGTHGQAILDRLVYTADMALTVFGTDQRNNDDIYKRGTQFDTRIAASFNDEPYLTQIGIRYIFRGRNQRYNIHSGAIESQLKKYGNEFSAFARVTYATGVNYYITAHLETRKLSASEEDFENSSVFNFGLNVRKGISKNFTIDLGANYFTGATESEAITIRGFQIAGGLTASL